MSERLLLHGFVLFCFVPQIRMKKKNALPNRKLVGVPDNREILSNFGNLTIRVSEKSKAIIHSTQANSSIR